MIRLMSGLHESADNFLPRGHEQRCPPIVLWQLAPLGHGLGFCLHSSTSGVQTNQLLGHNHTSEGLKINTNYELWIFYH
jgi:hypothetical protein